VFLKIYTNNISNKRKKKVIYWKYCSNISNTDNKIRILGISSNANNTKAILEVTIAMLAINVLYCQ